MVEVVPPWGAGRIGVSCLSSLRIAGSGRSPKKIVVNGNANHDDFFRAFTHTVYGGQTGSSPL
jgi:hypothetical protein